MPAWVPNTCSRRFAACFLGGMKFSALAKDTIALSAKPKLTADAGIGPRDDGPGFGLNVELKISLPDLDDETADKVIRGAMLFATIPTQSNIA